MLKASLCKGRSNEKGVHVPAIFPSTIILLVLAFVAAVTLAVVGSGEGKASAEKHGQADQRKLHGYERAENKVMKNGKMEALSVVVRESC